MKLPDYTCAHYNVLCTVQYLYSQRGWKLKLFSIEIRYKRNTVRGRVLGYYGMRFHTSPLYLVC